MADKKSIRAQVLSDKVYALIEKNEDKLIYLKQQIADATTELEETDRKIQEKKDAIDETEKAKIEAHTAAEADRQKILDGLDAQIKVRQEALDKLRLQNDARTKDLDQRELDVQKLEKEAKEKMDAALALVAELDKKEKQLVKREEKLIDKANDLARETDHLNELKGNTDQRIRELQEVQKAIDSDLLLVQSLRTELGEKKAELERVAADAELKTKQLGIKESQEAAFNEKLAAVVKREEALNQEFEDAKNINAQLEVVKAAQEKKQRELSERETTLRKAEQELAEKLKELQPKTEDKKDEAQP